MLWLIIAPSLFLPAVYLLRQKIMGKYLATIVCMGTALLAFNLPYPQITRLMGHVLIFDTLVAYIVALLFIGMACLFVVALHFSDDTLFYPIGLTILIILTIAIILRHLGVTILLFEFAIILAVFIVQGNRPNSARAALRFLVMMTLAVPFLLLANWQINQYQIIVKDSTFFLQLQFLIGCGFGIMFAVFPFHGWLSGISFEAKPYIAVFIFITFPTITFIIFFQLLEQHSWIINLIYDQEIIFTVGLATIIFAGVMTSSQRSLNSLMGYATLFNIGSNVMLLSLLSLSTLRVILFSIFVQQIALLLIALAGTYIEFIAKGNSFEQVHGLGKILPVPTIGLMVGGLTLAGVPFTAGFVSRQILLQSFMDMDVRWGAIILLGGLGVAIGYLRGGYMLVDTKHTTDILPVMSHDKPAINLLIFILIAITCGIGLFPQSVLQWFERLTQSLQIPVF